MKTYLAAELKEIISGLLQKGHEGDYWDYKQEWPTREKNTDLLKDIVCFANTVHDRDCFIIFGANDNGKIVRLKRRTRRTQNHILDLLNQQPFAGDNIPEIAVVEVSINDKLLDVLIIYNSARTPYYFSLDIPAKINNPANATPDDKKNTQRQIENKTLRKGVIYTRTGDRNTEFTKIANPYDVEQLWKKRFHLNKPILEQFYEALKKPEDWAYGKDNIYNIYRPEFSLIDDSYINKNFREFYTEIYSDRSACKEILLCKYFGNKIDEIYIINVDGRKYATPLPQIDAGKKLNNERYFYMLKESPQWYLQQFLYIKQNRSGQIQQDMFYKNIPLFSSKDEKLSFDAWVTEHHIYVDCEISEYKKIFSSGLDGQFKQDQFNSKFVIHLLDICRERNWQAPEGIVCDNS